MASRQASLISGCVVSSHRWFARTAVTAYSHCPLSRNRPQSSRHDARFDDGRVAVRMGSMLLAHVDALGLGVVGSEVGFVLSTGPDTVRAPDVAFVAAARAASAEARGFFAGPPDLAVEVLSPEDRATDI